MDFGLKAVAKRSKTLSKAIEGEPRLLVRDGRLLARAIKEEGLETEEVRAAIRSHGLAGPEDVRLAVLETDGSISVIPRDDAGRDRTDRRATTARPDAGGRRTDPGRAAVRAALAIGGCSPRPVRTVSIGGDRGASTRAAATGCAACRVSGMSTACYSTASRRRTRRGGLHDGGRAVSHRHRLVRRDRCAFVSLASMAPCRPRRARCTGPRDHIGGRSRHHPGHSPTWARTTDSSSTRTPRCVQVPPRQTR